MSVSRIVLSFLSCFLFASAIHAQFVDYGTDQARFRWNYVETGHYKLVYPQGNDSMARRYATFLENVYPHLDKTIGKPWKTRMPVVLHPGNMLSNGMVAWAPRRMEMITTPGTDLYAQSWDRQLVVHESRHVFQTGKLMQGIFRPLYYLAGEQVQGLVAVGVPQWLFEGDAVVIETAMSNSGRGRLPEFNMIYRSRMYSDQFFSFDKWVMGSYKDYTGNYYAIGYDMAAYARYAYGADVWDKVLQRYTRRIYAVPPFSNALQKYTGVKTKGLFDQTFSFLKEEWDRQLTPADPLHYLSPAKKMYTTYNYPQAIDSRRVVAVKSGLQAINSLVSLEDGHEKCLCWLGNINSPLRLSGNRIYWTEYVSGLRWTHENYSLLKYYDLATGKVVTLTHHSRYLAPAAGNNGNQVAVLRFDLSGTAAIVCLDSDTGTETRTFATPGNAFVKDMVFDGQDNLIAILINDHGLGISKLDLLQNSWQELLPPGSTNISTLAWYEGKLYFESGLNGINNIYALDPVTGETEKITSARFGAFAPTWTPDGSHLMIADFQANGYRIAALPRDSIQQDKVGFSEPYRSVLAETVAAQEQFNLDTATLTPVPFHPRPYRKAAHLFNIHSWAPFYYDVMDVVNLAADDFTTVVKPGATVISQNALNTLIGQAGWYYRKGYHHGKVALTYMGWYPVIDFTVDYGDKAFDIVWQKVEQEGRVYETLGSAYPGRNLVEAEARMYIPFNFTRNHWIKGFQPILTYYLTNNRYQQYESRNMRNFQYMLAELRYYQYHRMAQRDILPRLGYQVCLQYFTTPFNTENYGNLYTARLTGYLPGLLPNHSLMLRAGYQYQNVDNKYMYVPKRLLNETRGYDYVYRTRQQWEMKADYAFSLFCPDVSIGSLAYIKRLRTNLFYDLTYNQVNETSGWDKMSAYGFDLIFDWNIFRLNYPLATGIRVINPINYGDWQAELLFSVSF